MLEKAAALDVDEVVLDLEDAVAATAKATAREVVAEALRRPGWTARSVAVRVNDWKSPWTYTDVLALLGRDAGRLNSIVLPKTESAADVQALDRMVSQAERCHGLPAGTVRLQAQVETAAGLARVAEIATSSSRLDALLFGPADFSASLGVQADDPAAEDGGAEEDAFTFARMSLLVAARANGLQAVDGPCLAAHDGTATARSASRAADLGFDGKWVIHPSQIGPTAHAFSPTSEAYIRATELLEAHAAAADQAGGANGATLFRGRMIDEALKKLAEGVVSRYLASRGVGA